MCVWEMFKGLFGSCAYIKKFGRHKYDVVKDAFRIVVLPFPGDFQHKIPM